MRAGQSFLNEFFPDVADSVLYYCEDNERCWVMIQQKYVDYTQRYQQDV